MPRVFPGRPVESQFGARETMLRGPTAGCLTHEANMLCRQWSFGKYTNLYSKDKFRL